jgi:hypothetical protein
MQSSYRSWRFQEEFESPGDIGIQELRAPVKNVQIKLERSQTEPIRKEIEETGEIVSRIAKSIGVGTERTFAKSLHALALRDSHDDGKLAQVLDERSHDPLQGRFVARVRTFDPDQWENGQTARIQTFLRGAASPHEMKTMEDAVDQTLHVTVCVS